MNEGDKIYLIDPKVDDGSIETLPFTDRMEVITDEELLDNGMCFSAEQKVCITCEMALELLMDRIDGNRRKAIEALKDKFTFRQTLAQMYPGYLYRLVKAKNVKNLCINGKYMIKPFKGYYGTAVRAIDAGTDFVALSMELDAELLNKRRYFPEGVLSGKYFIVEQFVEGEEYAVDMFYDSKGEPCIVNIYHHPMPKNIAYLHMLYYSSKENFDKIYKKAKVFFKGLNKILSVKNFAVHAEFKLQYGDLFPIELNPMRFGGAGLGNMLYHSLGINPYLCFLNETEPDWGSIWKGKEHSAFIFFIAYNGETKPLTKYKPNIEKLKQNFSNILVEIVLDYHKQMIFAMFFLQENVGDIKKLLEIEFDDFFDER